MIYCEGGLEGNALSGEGGEGGGKGAEVDASGKTALSKLEFRPFTLHSVERVSHNTRLYRFSLPSEEHQTVGVNRRLRNTSSVVVMPSLCLTV